MVMMVLNCSPPTFQQSLMIKYKQKQLPFYNKVFSSTNFMDCLYVYQINPKLNTANLVIENNS